MRPEKGQSDLVDLLCKQLRLAQEAATELKRLNQKYQAMTESEHFGCGQCLWQYTCKQPCDWIEPQLPKTHQGRPKHENLTGFFPDTLSEVQDRRRLDIFQEYQACKEPFTKGQWEAIHLYWKCGMTQSQIARSLGLKRSAVSGRLARAAVKKERHDKRMRRERLENYRRIQNK